MPTAFADGLVRVKTVELNIALHCNLSCEGCSHASPLLAPEIMAPEQVERDLSLLASALHARQVKLIGGEPLLNPRIVEIMDVVRASGVADRIKVVTNGLLLGRMPRAFWQKADIVLASRYPSRSISQAQEEEHTARAARWGHAFHVLPEPPFRQPWTERPHREPALVARIYASCRMAHRFSCHTVHQGRFYKCPLALFIPQALSRLGLGEVGAARDGLALSNKPDFARRLHAYLMDPQPLPICRHCLGSVGRPMPHRQLSLAERRQPGPRGLHAEELLDLEHLLELEREAARG